MRHELLADEFPRRLRFSKWFNQRCRRERFLDSFIIGDETAFLVNGEVNTYNLRQYAPKGQPPTFNFERNDSRAKLAVWAALCGNDLLLGPYIFGRNVNRCVFENAE